MTQTLLSLNYLHILLITIAGYAIGAIWYAVLFGKAWMSEMKTTPEEMKAKGGGPITMVKTFLLTIPSTIALAAVVVRVGSVGFLHGAELGAFIGVGIVAVREGVNAMYELKTFKHFLIVSGHDVVLLTVQAALLTRWH